MTTADKIAALPPMPGMLPEARQRIAELESRLKFR